jgi:DNA-binding IclR family transcriptional regulator
LFNLLNNHSFFGTMMHMLAQAPSLSMPDSVEDAGGTLRLVPAVERAVRLLDLLAAAGRPLPLAELTRELELPKSSLHGLLATLVALGLARREPDGLFGLGLKPLQWADAFAAQSDLLRTFDAHAGSFAELEPETVMLAVLEGDQVVYLSCRQGSRPLAVNFRVGGRFPACCTSSGKAMLASLTDAQVREILGDGPLPRLTRHGIETLDALQEQLVRARARGYAVDDEETAEGMQCFGAPIHAARQSNAVAAVAVSLIKAGLTPQRRDAIVTAITELARRISTTLGG